MKKITRMILISAVLATSGLTAKIATENYKAVVTNDERIHKAHELAKKPNKAAVLEAIVDATNAESDERIQGAVIIEPESPKAVRIKTKVTTSAGISPIASVMAKKTVNKAEEFIEKIAHPAEGVMEDVLDFTPDNIPDANIPVHELKYELKDIFPAFEESEEETLTYKIILPDSKDLVAKANKNYFFDANNDESILNCIILNAGAINIGIFPFDESYMLLGGPTKLQTWSLPNNASDVVKFDPASQTLDYTTLAPLKDSNERIKGYVTDTKYYEIPTNKEMYDFLAGVETGKYKLLAVQ